jgi:hypothetical protein
MACGNEFTPQALTSDPDAEDQDIRYYGQVDCGKCGKPVGFVCVPCFDTGKTPPGPHEHTPDCPTT